ncbi:glycosyltransferase [Psychrobacter sp. FME2]|nr:glycosyltransferase [Pseudomonas lundensis]
METVDNAFNKYINKNYLESYFKYKYLQIFHKSKAFEANILLAKKHLPILDESCLDYILKSNGIECVYVLNLEQRLDRRIKVLREFSKIGIDPTIIKAVDAEIDKDVDKRFRNFMEAKSHVGEYTSHIKEEKLRRIKKNIHRGAFGYLMTQKKIFKDAIKKGYNKVCVFDDDIFFTENFEPDLKFVLEKLNGSYKIIMLGASDYHLDENKEFGKSVQEQILYNPIPGRTLGSFGAIYDSSIFEEVIKAIDSNLGTFDNVVLGHLFNKYNEDCYVINPNICIPCVEESDIRKDNREQQAHSEKMNWDISNFKDYKMDVKYSFILNSIEQIQMVKNLNTSLLNYASLNLFYISEDGLRSLILGRDVLDEGFLKNDLIDISNYSQEKTQKYVENIPYSDFLFILDNSYELTTKSLKFLIQDVFRSNRKTLNSNYKVILNSGKVLQDTLTSIIIPCYRKFEKCWPSIESALQVHGNVEVLIINDNPENMNFENDLSVKLQNKNIRKNIVVYSHKRNRGASAARNTGLWLSNGEFVCFLDDDDIYLKERVEKSVNILKDTKETIGSVYCGFSGGGHDKHDSERFKSGNLFNDIISIDYLKHYINTDTKTYKRSAIIKLGGFNETYRRHQDIELNSRFFKLYNTVAIKSYDVKIRPEKQQPTFTANYDNIFSLKRKFISDFKEDISHLDKITQDNLIHNHAKDIHKRIANPDERNLIKIKNQLKEILD